MESVGRLRGRRLTAHHAYVETDQEESINNVNMTICLLIMYEQRQMHKFFLNSRHSSQPPEVCWALCSLTVVIVLGRYLFFRKCLLFTQIPQRKLPFPIQRVVSRSIKWCERFDFVSGCREAISKGDCGRDSYGFPFVRPFSFKQNQDSFRNDAFVKPFLCF